MRVGGQGTAFGKMGSLGARYWYSPAPGWVYVRWGALTPFVDYYLDYRNHRYWLRGVGEVPWSAVHSLSRASTEFAVNTAGELVNFASGVPAITDAGWLIQESQTNLLLRSQELNQTWGASRLTVDANVIAAPDGTITADKLAETAETGTHRVIQVVAKAAAPVTYTVSAFFKAAERTFAQIRVSEQAEVNVAGVAIDLTTGQVSAPYGAFTAMSAKSKAFIGGWWRLEFTFTTLSGAQVVTFLLPALNLNAEVPTYPGTTGYGIYAWGAMLRAGAYTGSYIPTAASTASRAADVPQATGALATMMRASKSMFFKTIDVTGGTTPRLFEDNNNVGRFLTPTVVAVTTTGSGGASATIGGAGTYRGLVRTAFGMDEAGTSAIANGGTKATDATPWNRTPATFYFGNISSGERALNGYMREIAGSMRVKGLFDGATAP